jgi:hypothetical protein
MFLLCYIVSFSFTSPSLPVIADPPQVVVHRHTDYSKRISDGGT